MREQRGGVGVFAFPIAVPDLSPPLSFSFPVSLKQQEAELRKLQAAHGVDGEQRRGGKG